jgi:hypothetical protein
MSQVEIFVTSLRNQFKRKGKNMNKEEHKERHAMLHKLLDELVADFIIHTDKRPSITTVLEFMQWSYEQTINPSEKGGDMRENKA